MNTFSRPAMLLAVAVGVLSLTGTDSSAQGTAISPLPRVYVFTQVAKPGEPVAPDQEARQQSVEDVREALRKKTGVLEVVDAFDRADLTVEVLSRETPSSGRCLVSVRLHVVGRSQARQFQGQSRTWKDAAALVADIVVRFVNESY